MEKLLTVVVPTYNMQDYLDFCLTSFIVNEKIEELEVLVVNDGSTDNSLEIAKSYQKNFPNIFNVIDKQNAGHGSAINVGLANASGKYFKMVDADDWVDTQEFEKLLSALKNTDADLIINDYTMVFKSMDTNFVDLNKKINKKIKKVVKKCSIKPSEKMLNLSDVSLDNFTTIHAVTYKTKCIKNKIKITENCYYVDAEFLNFCYANIDTVIYFPFNVYQYRLGRVGQSMSSEGLYKHRLNHETVTKNLLSFAYNVKDIDKQKIILNNVHRLIASHYVKYLYFIKKDKSTLQEIKDYDNYLKENYPASYDYVGENFQLKFIKKLRKRNFKNASFYRRLITIYKKLARLFGK